MNAKFIICSQRNKSTCNGNENEFIFIFIIISFQPFPMITINVDAHNRWNFINRARNLLIVFSRSCIYYSLDLFLDLKHAIIHHCHHTTKSVKEDLKKYNVNQIRYHHVLINHFKENQS